MEWLLSKLKSYSNREALIYEDCVYTYNDILNEYDRLIKYFEQINLQCGEVVAIDGDSSPTICAAVLALAINKNIMVLLNTQSKEEKNKLIEIAECSRLFSLDGNKLEHIKLPYIAENELLKKLTKQQKPGLVLFTSGSTGVSKGVVHDFHKLTEKYKITKGPMRTLAFLLLDHIGGINTMLHTFASGGTLIISKNRFPDNVCQIIEKHKAEILPTSPTFLNLLLVSECYKLYDLSSLKIITYGTEVMPEATLLKLNKIFPNVKIKQTYGLSEVGILRSKSESSSSLWMKIGGEGFQTKIIEDILYVKADSAFLGYLNAPNPFEQDGWLNTRDKVLTKGDYIRILGRDSEIINVGGEKVYPAEVENILIQIPNIKNAIVKGEPNPIMGNVVIAKINLVEPENHLSIKKRIREFCKSRLETYKIPVKIEIAKEELFNSRFKNIKK